MKKLLFVLMPALLATASCITNTSTNTHSNPSTNTSASPQEGYLSLTESDGKGVPNGNSLASEFLDWLEPTDDPLYGVVPEKPILIGGYLEGRGGTWTAQYFSSILGPNGEQTEFERVGTCCAFSLTDQRLLDIGRKAGLLDVYQLVIPSTGVSTKVYVSIYEEGDVFILKGYAGRLK